jgi:murein DD-endopeptidase MepM/ murein hydrolase activator NlpD
VNKSEVPIVKRPSRYLVLAEWLVVCALVVLPLSAQFGLVEARNQTGTVEVQPAVDQSAISTTLLSAVQHPNPQSFRGGAEVLVIEGALVSSGPVGEDLIASARTSNGEISVYTVRAGDTISHIAEMYGVTVNTIMWANDLTRATSIKEGQTLVILPIAGVRHTIARGDTIASIAKKYEGDVSEILAYNQLTTESELTVGSSLVIPGGLIKPAAPPASATPTRVAGSVSGGGSWLSHPSPGAVKTQGLHGYNAVDLAGSIGAPIRAAAAGEVIVSRNSGWNGGYGNYVVIRHPNGAQTLYAHLSRSDVGVGSYVTQGQVIGAMGNTGRSTGPHLHFEVRGASNPF